MVEEKVFLNEGGFLVTNTRFEIPGQMFAMAGVTSVGVNQIVPSKLWPIVMMILGIGMMGAEVYDIGGVFLLLGGLWFWLKKTVYHLILTTAAGQQTAHQSKDGEFMGSLRTALTNAIIDRG